MPGSRRVHAIGGFRPRRQVTLFSYGGPRSKRRCPPHAEGVDPVPPSWPPEFDELTVRLRDQLPEVLGANLVGLYRQESFIADLPVGAIARLNDYVGAEVGRAPPGQGGS